MAARVIIVEDDSFTRMLLRGQLEQLGFDVVGDAATVNDAMALAGVAVAAGGAPDIALVDLDLGRGPTGIDLAHALRDRYPRIGIVLLTSYADVRLIGDQRPLPPGSLALVKRSLEDPQQLEATLQQVEAHPTGGPPAPVTLDRPRLSDGQAEILRLVANGFSNAEIARRRHLSESAVIKAVGRLADQLGLLIAPGDNQRVVLTQAYFQLTGTAGPRRE